MFVSVEQKSSNQNSLFRTFVYHMKNDTNLLVTVSARKSRKFQVFVTNKAERSVFDVREFASKKEAVKRGNDLANRWSCEMEIINK